jgi:4-amino-4-deoxy-L-arabinose transferase-like glycosyltransferase
MRTWRAFIPILVLLLLAVVVYLPHMSRTIAYDESFTLRHYASQGVLSLINYSLPNNHLLHSLMVWISTSLIGNSLIGLRLPAFLFTLLSLAMVFHLGNKIGGKTAGIAAFVLLALHYEVAGYGMCQGL